jgi:signal transduction histidine kinase
MSQRDTALTIGALPGVGACCSSRLWSERLPDSPSKPALSRGLRLVSLGRACQGLVRRAVDEGRAALRGLHSDVPLPAGLEQAFLDLLHEVASERGVRLRIFIQGQPRVLKPATQEQFFLIGREAVVNALRHSHATNIEVEVQYRRRFVRLFVRDNGCGIQPDAARNAGDSHSGLRGMCDRAEDIGAQFGIWSRPGAGTEVRVEVSER